MENLRNFNQAPEADAMAQRIKELVDNGEAFDVEDAEMALIQEADALFYREADKEQSLERINDSLKKLDAEAGALNLHLQDLKELDENAEEINSASGELADCDIDRQDLRFSAALIFAADNAIEREYLYYNYQLDQLGTIPDQEAAQPANAVPRRRLETKAQALAEEIGNDRARKIFEKYRQQLQELFNSY